MTLFALKLLAIITMTIDHTGGFFFAHDINWVIVGRLAFPIFAWGIANGYAHTKDAYAYMSRLLGFAVLSQIPFSLGYVHLGYDPTILNIFFTLAIGLLAIIKFEEATHPIIGWVWLAVFVVWSSFFKMDYGGYGVLMIFFFHLTYRQIIPTVLLQLFLFFMCSAVAIVLWQEIPQINILLIHPVQVFSLIALLPIALYTGEQGPKFSKWFYWFYPVHLTVLLILAVVLT